MVLFISILTIVFSGLIAAVVTFRLNKSHEMDKQRSSRLEELYQRLNEYDRLINSSLLPYHMAMAGKIDYNQANDIFLKNEVNRNSVLRTRLLVDLYFRELKPDLANFEEQKDKSFRLIKKFRRSYEKDGLPREDLSKEMYKLATEMEESIKLLKEKVVGLV